MRGAIPPLPHAASWRDAKLNTREKLIFTLHKEHFDLIWQLLSIILQFKAPILY
jgi:hypothetical protein